MSSNQYVNSSNMIDALKELYDEEVEHDPVQDILEYLGQEKKPRKKIKTSWMRDLVYKENPFLALLKKDDKNE